VEIEIPLDPLALLEVMLHLFLPSWPGGRQTLPKASQQKVCQSITFPSRLSPPPAPPAHPVPSVPSAPSVPPVLSSAPPGDVTTPCPTLDTPCRAGHNQAGRSGVFHGQTIRPIASIASLLRQVWPVDARPATPPLDPPRRGAVRLPLSGLRQFRRLQDGPETGGPIPEGRLAATLIDGSSKRRSPGPTQGVALLPSAPFAL